MNYHTMLSLRAFIIIKGTALYQFSRGQSILVLYSRWIATAGALESCKHLLQFVFYERQLSHQIRQY